MRRIFCKDCGHIDPGLGNMCGFRKIFIKPNKGRFCQDFIPKAIPGLVKEPPKETIIAPIEEEVPIKTQQELNQPKPEIKPKKLSWWQKILKFLKLWR